MRADASLTRADHGAQPTGDFDAIYGAEFPYVWHSLRRLGVQGRDLEDLTHDVFATAFRRRADYDPSRPMRPWLFGIAFRVASEFRRRAHTARVVADETADALQPGLLPDEEVAARQA